MYQQLMTCIPAPVQVPPLLVMLFSTILKQSFNLKISEAISQNFKSLASTEF